jgi:crotonobetainyl-CoA:carnitine CoA-transferase CaiB-like acyl-CoA transferase
MGDITVDGHSFKLSKTPARLRKAPPCLGEDTEFVCRNILGMSKEEFKELVENAEVFT